MSQAEVQEFLEKHKGEWFTSKQISDAIKIGNTSCTNNIARLRRHGLIMRRVTGKVCNFEYSYKSTMIRNRPLALGKLKEELKE